MTAQSGSTSDTEVRVLLFAGDGRQDGYSEDSSSQRVSLIGEKLTKETARTACTTKMDRVFWRGHWVNPVWSQNVTYQSWVARRSWR
jgi:hypothetical protein